MVQRLKGLERGKQRNQMNKGVKKTRLFKGHVRYQGGGVDFFSEKM